MKAKIFFFIAAVALVTLSFTFASVQGPHELTTSQAVNTQASGQVGGLISDEVVK